MGEYINKNLAISELLDCKLAGSSGMIFASEALKKLVDVPAEDVEPVIHGRWLKNTRFKEKRRKCSECGFDSEFEFNFCPNCGAKMDLRY